jgi:predicted transcriptional regulator
MSTIIDKRGNFTIVENELIHNYELSPNEGWLYIVLLSHVNRQTGVAFPGYGRLARLAKMSRSSVIRTINSLIEKGFIAKRSNFNGMEYDSNEYTFLSLRVVSDRHHPSVTQNIGVVSDRHHPSVTQTPGVSPQTPKPDSLTRLTNQSDVTSTSTPPENPLKKKLKERGAPWQN